MKYQYVVSGIFSGTDGEEYEINIPFPYVRNTEVQAMCDGHSAYRFILFDEDTGPELCIFEGEDFRAVNEGDQKYLKIWVKGNCLKSYNFDEFQKIGGTIRMLKPELKAVAYINGNTDYISTDKTFKDAFPNMQKMKPYYIDNCAYDIKEIKEVR